MKEIYVYTDGSCLNNPGPGGYGVILRYKEHEREISKGYQNTTNNRMELMAVIAALLALKEPCHVHINTDSQYVKNGITKWIDTWRQNGWKTANKGAVKNQDLWLMLDKLCIQHRLEWHWVKGHAGHVENERCDKLARTAAQQDISKLELKDTAP